MQLGDRRFKQGERSRSTLGKKKPAGMIKSPRSVEKNSVNVSNNENPDGKKEGRGKLKIPTELKEKEQLIKPIQS